MSIRINFYLVLLLLSSTPMVSLAADAPLETMEKKFSYTLGYTFAAQMKSQIVEIDKAALIKAIDDVFDGKDPRITKEEMAEALTGVKESIVKASREKAQKNLEAGQKFLEENKSKEGVVVLPSGVQYKVLTKGAGDSPKKDANVTVHYVGTHINGTVFDSSKRQGGPVTFNLARVVPGFSESISQMKPGSKWQIFIPAELGYGARGAPPAVMANEALIFEVELVSSEDSKKAEDSKKTEDSKKAG